MDTTPVTAPVQGIVGSIDVPLLDRDLLSIEERDVAVAPAEEAPEEPEAEKTATVRNVSRMSVTGANLSIPFVMVLGGMGLEGAVRLGYRREPAAAEDPDALFDELVARSYERGKALSAATV